MNSITAVAITQLVVYIIFLPLIVYLLYAHGKRGLLGYIYLLIFCILQLISAGLQISNPTNTAAIILSSVGLSPLLLGLAGIVHEVHQYLSVQSGGKEELGWVFQLILHLVTIAAVAIIAIGAANLDRDVGTSKYHHDLTLRKVGSIILLLAFLAITAHACWVFLNNRSSTYRRAKRLLYSILPALPPIFSRLFYTIVYSFAAPSSRSFRILSPGTAPIAIRVIFILLLPLLAVLSLIIGGFLSRQLAQRRQEQRPQRFENDQSQELEGVS